MQKKKKKAHGPRSFSCKNHILVFRKKTIYHTIWHKRPGWQCLFPLRTPPFPGRDRPFAGKSSLMLIYMEDKKNYLGLAAFFQTQVWISFSDFDG